MPEDSVEVVRKLFAALDGENYEDVLGLFDPEVEWLPAEGSYAGIEGVVQSFIDWMEPWDEHTVILEETTASGQKVLAVVHLTGRGSSSGMEIDQRFFQVYTLREGKIIRMDEFVDRDPAAKAAGLG
jgi:uncharacterized protein